MDGDLDLEEMEIWRGSLLPLDTSLFFAVVGGHDVISGWKKAGGLHMLNISAC